MLIFKVLKKLSRGWLAGFEILAVGLAVKNSKLVVKTQIANSGKGGISVGLEQKVERIVKRTLGTFSFIRIVKWRKRKYELPQGLNYNPQLAWT